MKHPYRAILIWLLFTGIFALVLFVEAKAGEKPNVILIMCDDLGWGDVGFNGGTHIRTPHLDEMAANGLNLTRFYAQAPVCARRHVRRW